MPDIVYGNIYNIQRYCINDGPGIRTTVFLQGCHLNCPWCHNPDSRSFAPSVSCSVGKCLNCGLCKEIIPGGNCRRVPAQTCSACGICANECPAGALTLLGKKMTVSEVMDIVERDAFFYQQTNGGMTLSGGEPLAQPVFAAALLQEARNRQIHTAIETSGAVTAEVFEDFLPLCDLWLFDLKAAKSRYTQLTGADPETVMRNLHHLSANGAGIILRVPLVPGGNADEEFLQELQELKKLPGVIRTDILPYHKMGIGKNTMAGIPEPEWERFSEPDDADVKRWSELAN